VHAVVTNSTYDGLCYRATRVAELLGQSVDRLHFDEAWFGYAPFNPLYAGRFGLAGGPAAAPAVGPTVFAVTSTHKLLAALSQASYIHVRDGRRPVEHGRFNESFMMHASTSPSYAVLASNEVAAAMMDGPGGRTLTTEAIAEAVAFRQAVRRIRRDFAAAGDWFFTTWNADEVAVAPGGRRIPFEDAPPDRLIGDPDCWVLHPDESWHGFPDLEDGYCLLDPIKVSVVAPGVRTDGTFEAQGIPAAVVTAYLAHRGTLVEKTADFSLLFLFSLGVTKGKWGTLVSALLRFKDDYDANTPLALALPALAAAYPERYAGAGLRDLADEMFAYVRASRQLQLQAAAFSTLPVPATTPVDAYRRLVRGAVEAVPLDEMAGRVVATAVVPYPPGIPMLMPGEHAGEAGGPYLGYLRAIEDFDGRFPGFAHETHGVQRIEGRAYVYCLAGGA
jgi:arginine decarboxylase